MSIRLSHQLFADQGNAWNTPNWQNHSSPVIRHRRGFKGELVDVELEWEVEGYGPDGKPTRAPERRAYRDPAPKPMDPTPRLNCKQPHYPKHRPAEYRCLLPEVKVIPADAKLPTEADKARGKRQRAAIKARMTKAANRIKREAEEAAQAQAELLVKISQWEF